MLGCVLNNFAYLFVTFEQICIAVLAFFKNNAVLVSEG